MPISSSSGVFGEWTQTIAAKQRKAGAMIAGYDQTMRINEPGRTYWLKAQLSFD
jgi:iron complex outermembrane receptor protein